MVNSSVQPHITSVQTTPFLDTRPRTPDSYLEELVKSCERRCTSVPVSCSQLLSPALISSCPIPRNQQISKIDKTGDLKPRSSGGKLASENDDYSDLSSRVERQNQMATSFRAEDIRFGVDTVDSDIFYPGAPTRSKAGKSRYEKMMEWKTQQNIKSIAAKMSRNRHASPFTKEEYNVSFRKFERNEKEFWDSVRAGSSILEEVRALLS